MYRTLYFSTIATARDHTSNLPKICYCGFKSSKSICKFALTMSLLAYLPVRNVHKKGAWSLHIFFQNYNKQEGTGNFIYIPLILDKNTTLKHD